METQIKDTDESVPLLEDYLGMGRRTLYTLLALVAGAFVVATFVYIALYGFQSWKTNMARAGSQMVINYDVPVAAQNDFQYVCPNCGVVKQPGWAADGTPLCPSCGAQVDLK
jgi:predicted RNA-binding Zn-ribbon protein involved in translation (DUF1610 family)